MSYFDFALLLEDQINTYILCLILSILIYVLIFRKKILSIFDPFTLCLLGSMMGFSVVIFLKATNTISGYYFYQYIFSQVAFWLGFFMFNLKKIEISGLNNTPLIANSRYFYIYILASGLFILSNLAIYKVSGIPIFSEYRLGAVAVGGGFGLIRRFVNVLGPVCLYFSLYFLLASNKHLKYRLAVYIIMPSYFIIAILSGSKGAIMVAMQIVFLFFYLNREHFGNLIRKIKKQQFYILFLAGIMAVFVLILQTSVDFNESLIAILFRVISYGDVFYMGYPDGVVEHLSKANIFVVFFGDLFRTIRIFPPELAPPGIGFELYSLVSGVDAIGGPNPRHNVYGYVNFGFIGSLFFSFFCGFIVNRVRSFVLLSNKNMSQDRKILVLLLYFCFAYMETDPPASIAAFNNLILLFPIILFFNAILMRIEKPKLRGL